MSVVAEFVTAKLARSWCKHARKKDGRVSGYMNIETILTV
jgi:hypothetical protein